MKNTELRIGNYFLYDNRIQVVNGVIDINGGYRIDFKTEHKRKLVKYCHPIPLTEEWLLKFGFYTDNESWYYSLDFDKNQDTFKICPLYSNGIPSGMFSVLNCMACVKKIQFVHQLQNLYFALTGEELTLKQK